jgi:hypothetical protein
LIRRGDVGAKQAADWLATLLAEWGDAEGLARRADAGRYPKRIPIEEAISAARILDVA